MNEKGIQTKPVATRKIDQSTGKRFSGADFPAPTFLYIILEVPLWQKDNRKICSSPREMKDFCR
jgi:hypothetical protein